MQNSDSDHYLDGYIWECTGVECMVQVSHRGNKRRSAAVTDGFVVVNLCCVGACVNVHVRADMSGLGEQSASCLFLFLQLSPVVIATGQR